MMMMSSFPYHYYHKQSHDFSNDAFMLDNIFGLFKYKCFIFFVNLLLIIMGDVSAVVLMCTNIFFRF